MILLLVVYNIEIRYILLVSFTKKFIKGIFYYKDKIRNNKAIAEIVLNHSKNKLKDRKFIESTAISNTEKVDFKNEKVQDIIITHFKKYSEVEIDPAIFKKINTFQELINEVGKCEEMLNTMQNDLLANNNTFHNLAGNMAKQLLDIIEPLGDIIKEKVSSFNLDLNQDNIDKFAKIFEGLNK